MITRESWRGELKCHRVERIEYLLPRARYPRLHGKNAIRGFHGFGGEIEAARLVTDQGACGWASLCRGVRESRGVEELLLGRRLGEVFDPGEGILDERLLPFDLALHDLAGRILGVPVSAMMDQSAVSRVKVYDGAIYMNDLLPDGGGVERVVGDCADDYAAGHRMLKIKVGRSHQWMDHDEGLRRDIEVVRAVHNAFPDAALLADANDGYTVEDAIAFLEGIEGVSLYWLEEPFRESEPDNARLCAYLREHCPATYLADGESDTDIPLLFELAKKKLLDIWMPDVCGYGFTPWRKLLRQLAPLGLLGSPHAWGQVLKTNYCAHLAAAYPRHVPCVEGVLGGVEGVDLSGYRLSAGVLEIPQAPGFGMELEWAPAIEG